jgi:hypothetical protein
MRPSLCTECVLLPRRGRPHFFLRAIESATERWVFKCEVCHAEWSLEADGGREVWGLVGRLARN